MLNKWMWMGVIGIAGSAGILQASTLVVPRHYYVPYTNTISPTDVDVSGTLRVMSGGVFHPNTLDIFNGGTVNSAAPSGEENGDVYFDGGSISIQSITITGPAARVFVNSLVVAESVNNGADVYVNDNFFVTGGAGTYSTSARTVVSSSGVLRVGTFEQTDSLASLQGEGQVWADTFDFSGPGHIEPGIGAWDPGNLTLKSSSTIDLNEANLILDFDPYVGSDHLTIDGNIGGSINVLPSFVYSDPSELSGHGPFIFLTANTMSATLNLVDPSYTEVYDNDLNLVGHMVLKTNSTSAWFEYQPVPEPVLGLLVASGVLAGLRRRRS
jgi:hypothetical protein